MESKTMKKHYKFDDPKTMKNITKLIMIFDAKKMHFQVNPGFYGSHRGATRVPPGRHPGATRVSGRNWGPSLGGVWGGFLFRSK